MRIMAIMVIKSMVYNRESDQVGDDDEYLVGEDDEDLVGDEEEESSTSSQRTIVRKKQKCIAPFVQNVSFHPAAEYIAN